MPRPGIAIVGSRTPSAEAETFAYELARKLGEPIVSGLAPGIDVAAHRGALSAGAPMHAMRFAKELEKPRFAVMPPEEMKLRPEWAGNLALHCQGRDAVAFRPEASCGSFTLVNAANRTASTDLAAKKLL